MPLPNPIHIAPGTHATFGASSAHRWTKCPASIRLQKPYPNISGPAALEGTRVHAWLAHYLTTATFPHPDDYGVAHQDDSENILTRERAEIVAEAARKVWGYVKPEDELYIEKTWQLAEVHSSAFGTADVIVRKPNGDVIAIDFKNGGNRVPVSGNRQLMFYGLASRGPGAKVKGVIIQNNQAGGVYCDEYDYSEDELQAFAWDAAVAAAGADQAAPAAGDHCRYCRAATSCPALKKLTDEVAVASAPVGLTPETAPAALAKCGALKAYVDAVEEQAYALAAQGTPPKGYKLVAGRNSRDWISPDTPKTIEAETGLKLSTVEWISVAQAEKILKAKHKDALNGRVAVKPGKPKLVTLDHAGEAVTPSAQPNGFLPLNL